MEYSKLQEVLRAAVAEVSPEELDLFDIEASVLIEEAVTETPIKDFEGGDVQSKFALNLDPAMISDVCLYIKLICATVNTLKLFGFFATNRKLQPKRISELQAGWEQALQTEGIPAEKAVLIAGRFKEELIGAVQ